MSSLSLASRQAGRIRVRVVGTGRPCCHGLPTSHTAAAAVIFSVIAATGFWLSGGAVLAVLLVGAGHVALDQIPAISASPESTHAGREQSVRFSGSGQCEVAAYTTQRNPS